MKKKRRRTSCLIGWAHLQRLTAETDLDDLAGWLNEPAAEIEEEETADGWLGDELPDWLGTPATAEATAETDLDDLAGWLNEPAAEIEEEETTDDLDWLGGAAVASTADELPDWLGTPATAEVTEETDLDDLAGWLNEPAAEIEEEETADLVQDDDFEMEWLGAPTNEVVVAAEPLAPVAHPVDEAKPSPDPLDLNDEIFAAQLIELSDSDSPVSADLSWLMAAEEEPTADLSPLEDWLVEFADPDEPVAADKFGMASPVDMAEIEAIPNLPDEALAGDANAAEWVEDLALLAAPLDEPVAEGESPDWLEEWAELEHSGLAASEPLLLSALDERLMESESAAELDEPEIPEWLLNVPVDEPEPLAPAKLAKIDLASLEDTLSWLEELALADD